jgi:hypothetical protein
MLKKMGKESIFMEHKTIIMMDNGLTILKKVKESINHQNSNTLVHGQKIRNTDKEYFGIRTIILNLEVHFMTIIL